MAAAYSRRDLLSTPADGLCRSEATVPSEHILHDPWKRHSSGAHMSVRLIRDSSCGMDAMDVPYFCCTHALALR